MKAIHNSLLITRVCRQVGNYKLKYNFESNSQQKQLHTIKMDVGNYKLKYNFESNSQQLIQTKCLQLGW
ncbi:hypothetical protein FPG87_06160 [Flavobacterium psychrophilum]|nr:hypothetical protein FPG87_06160 [Flavobacterium psychrophilum]